MKLNRILAGLCLAVCLAGAANAATLLPNGKQQFFSASGAPLAGGTIQFYIPNTSTPKDTWQDAGQTILNSNPVVLDAAGSATIYGAGAYRQVVRDSAGNLIWDQITSDPSSTSSTSWAGISSGSANAQTINAANFTAADGQSITFVAGFTNTGALTLNPNGTGPINVVNDTPTGSVTMSGGEVVAGNIVQVIYSATGGVFHTALSVSTVPSGVVQEFAGSTPPSGFLFANGQCISRTTYSRLFSIIGTNFGACDGATTFAVPDRRGYVAIGKDDMGGTDAGRLTGAFTSRLVLGGTGGEKSHTLSIAELPVVTPTGTVTVSYPAHSYSRANATGTGAAPGSGIQTFTLVSDFTGPPGPQTFSLSMGSYGGGTTHNIIQPSIVMNFIIKT